MKTIVGCDFGQRRLCGRNKEKRCEEPQLWGGKEDEQFSEDSRMIEKVKNVRDAALYILKHKILNS